MNNLIKGFRDCAHQAGVICSVPEGKLIRAFGLEDYLVNGVVDGDDVPTIAVKALAFFCEGQGPQNEAFKSSRPRGRHIPQPVPRQAEAHSTSASSH